MWSPMRGSMLTHLQCGPIISSEVKSIAYTLLYDAFFKVSYLPVKQQQ